ncbi:hypothetical protein QEN19_001891 [Hanseniaspora menglaensis]
MMFFSNTKCLLTSIVLMTFTMLMKVVNADVQVVLPSYGRTFEVSGSTVPITIAWLDNQQYPDLDSDVNAYTFSLCSGPNSHIESIKTLATRISPDDITLDGIIYSYDIEIDADIAASGIFFIQVYASGSFGYTIHYSERFSISGLTGTLSATAAGAATAPPSAQYSINTGTTTVPTINSASFSIPYPKQSGISKFAPMQTQPLTSVTNPTASWSRRFPSSDVTYYTTALAGSKRDCTTTITPGWSYYISSDINYASGLTKSSTGYDPKERQTRTTSRLV